MKKKVILAVPQAYLKTDHFVERVVYGTATDHIVFGKYF